MNPILSAAIVDSVSYQAYRSLVASLLSENKTTGPDQSPEYIHYTLMNDVRMKRLDRTTEILNEFSEEIALDTRGQIWLIITEAWCGDAAQVIPVIEKLASVNQLIETRYVLRDENLELMDMYLTNGGKSIPKVIVIDKSRGEVLMDWGPRPKEVQDMVEARMKEESPVPYLEFAIGLQKWYAKDKTLSIQNEFMDNYRSSTHS